MYGLKYYSELYNVGNQLIRVEILGKDYIGAAEGLRMDGDVPVKLSVKERDRDESVISKGGKLNFFQETPFKFKDLFTTAELDHQVKIFKEGNLIFIGFVDPAVFEQSLENINTIVTIPFADGLQLLSEYTVGDVSLPGNPDLDDYYYRLIDLLKVILAQTGLSLPIRVNSTLFESNMDSQSDITLFSEVLLSRDVFQDHNLKTLLDEILRGFRLSQINGTWTIDRLKDMALTTKKYIQYNTDGTETVINEVNNILVANEDVIYHATPSYSLKTGYRQIKAKVDLIDIENFAEPYNLGSATDNPSTTNFPKMDINDVEKHTPITITQLPSGKFDVTFDSGIVKYQKGSNIGSTIRTRLKPFSFSAETIKDILEITITYEIPDDVLTANYNDNSNNHYISFIAAQYGFQLESNPAGSWVWLDSTDNKWYLGVDPQVNFQVFEIDYRLARMREDERTIQHTISVKLSDIINTVDQTRRDRGYKIDYDFYLHVFPLCYGDDLDNDDFDDAVPVHTIIKNVEASVREETIPNNEFIADLNDKYRETKEIPMLLSDMKSANFANTMYILIPYEARGQIYQRIGKTESWSDDGANWYDYNTKYLIDIYQIFSRGRSYISGDVNSIQMIETNTLIREDNIDGQMLFFVSGFDWNLKKNIYRIKLNEYSNNEQFTVIE